VAKAVEAIVAAGNFTEAPIYLPEVYQIQGVGAGIKLVSDESITEPVAVTTEGEGAAMTTTVRFRGPEMRPYVRFLLAKELFKHLSRTGHSACARFSASPTEVLDIQANIFAGMMLVPGKMLRKEVERIDSSLDIVLQLAETFWVSKALMNQRLRDYMENLT
jgi:hypothetical protein